MKHHDIWEHGLRFLAAATRQLSTLGFDVISKCPEYPSAPDVNLEVPAELSSVRFTVMKDTQPDGSIRVAIQMYRHRFLGIGAMRADGFFISRGNVLPEVTEQDALAVT